MGIVIPVLVNDNPEMGKNQGVSAIIKPFFIPVSESNSHDPDLNLSCLINYSQAISF